MNPTPTPQGESAREILTPEELEGEIRYAEIVVADGRKRNTNGQSVALLQLAELVRGFSSRPAQVAEFLNDHPKSHVVKHADFVRKYIISLEAKLEESARAPSGSGASPSPDNEGLAILIAERLACHFQVNKPWEDVGEVIESVLNLHFPSGSGAMPGDEEMCPAEKVLASLGFKFKSPRQAAQGMHAGELREVVGEFLNHCYGMMVNEFTAEEAKTFIYEWRDKLTKAFDKTRAPAHPAAQPSELGLNIKPHESKAAHAIGGITTIGAAAQPGADAVEVAIEVTSIIEQALGDNTTDKVTALIQAYGDSRAGSGEVAALREGKSDE